MNLSQFRTPKAQLTAVLVFALLIGGVAIASYKITPVKKLFRRDTSTPSQNQDASTNTNDSTLPDTINYSPSKPEDNNQINQQKENVKDNDQSTPSVTNNQLTATITNTRVVGSLAQVSVLVTGGSSGTCSLTLSKASAQDVTKNVNIISREGITVCEDFNVPTSGLVAGVWDVAVVLKSDSGQSKSAVGTIQIQ